MKTTFEYLKAFVTVMIILFFLGLCISSNDSGYYTANQIHKMDTTHYNEILGTRILLEGTLKKNAKTGVIQILGGLDYNTDLIYVSNPIENNKAHISCELHSFIGSYFTNCEYVK